MTNITQNINQVRARILESAKKHGRNPDDITLLAVSKTQSADRVRGAFSAGLTRFGENYVQEALDKIAALGDLPIEWHFIGPLQSNKTRAVSENFHWVHSVERAKIARRLNDQRPPGLPPLNVCIQVNIDDQATKSGVAPDELPALAQAIAELPRLRLRGLMAIPAPCADPEHQRQPFFRLRQQLDTLRRRLPALTDLDTLSMGMTADLEAAIAEGATIVRVGTAIFGERNATPRGG